MIDKLINISCLPVAGIENPYQYLMIEGLRKSDNLNVQYGVKGKIFPILRTVWANKPDYIHFDWIHQYYLRRKRWMTWVQFPFFVIDVLAAIYIFKVKIVWTLHNIQPHDQPTSGPYRWSRQFFANYCEWIRVFSKGTISKASDFLKVKSNKFVIVPEGDYVEYYPNKISNEDARRKLSLKKEAFVFLFFGSIRPYKGIEDLILTFKKHTKRGEKLLIAGHCKDLEYENKINELLGKDEKIIFISSLISPIDIQLYMNAADVVVLPFKKVENSGSAILAMGFAKPIIAPYTGVLPIRLKAQSELLYRNNLDEIFIRVKDFNKEKLLEFGQKNKISLSKYKWSDFASKFK